MIDAVAKDRQRMYGVLLPHFGSGASRERLLDGIRLIDRLGFDSVWVRDHLVYHPHAYEDPDQTNVDPFVVLSAAAALSDRLVLATGALIPHRHPIHAALLLGSLDFLAPGRVLATWGLGNFDHEFEAGGMGGWNRREVLREQVGIMQRLWGGETLDHEGQHYAFTDVGIRPVPGPDRTIPVWYGGSSKAAVRRAVEYCQGWMASRVPRRDFRDRMARMTRLADEAGRDVPTAGIIPLVSLAPTVEEGLRNLDLDPLYTACTHQYTQPPSGSFSNLDDLDGAVIAGPPDVIVEQVHAYQELGAQHVVFDLRAQFDRWEQLLHLLAESVLPALRSGGTTT